MPQNYTREELEEIANNPVAARLFIEQTLINCYSNGTERCPQCGTILVFNQEKLEAKCPACYWAISFQLTRNDLIITFRKLHHPLNSIEK